MSSLTHDELNDRIQLAEGLLEDRRALIRELEQAGHDTKLIREMVLELQQSLAEMTAQRDRIDNAK